MPNCSERNEHISNFAVFINLVEGALQGEFQVSRVSSAASLLGLARSLLTYYAIPFRIARMAKLYAPFIRRGDLCFDLGAHVGNHVAAFVHLGARVVAAEPQPLFFNLLRRLYGKNAAVTLIDQAAGAAPGAATLHISRRTPTVATLSSPWADSVRRARSFSGVRWEESITVRVTTLDALIGQFGEPAFCKIDVEGYELEALRGLSRPIRALSLEYIPASVEIALGSVDRLMALGEYEFNVSSGETHRLALPGWVDAGAIKEWLSALPSDARSGDLYARLRGSRV